MGFAQIADGRSQVVPVAQPPTRLMPSIVTDRNHVSSGFSAGCNPAWAATSHDRSAAGCPRTCGPRLRECPRLKESARLVPATYMIQHERGLEPWSEAALRTYVDSGEREGRLYP